MDSLCFTLSRGARRAGAGIVSKLSDFPLIVGFLLSFLLPSPLSNFFPLSPLLLLLRPSAELIPLFLFSLFFPTWRPLSVPVRYTVRPCPHSAAAAGLNYAPLSTSYFPQWLLLSSSPPPPFPIIPSPSLPPSLLVHKYKLKSESGEGNFRRRMLSRGMAFPILPVRSSLPPSVRPSIHYPSKDHRHSKRSSSSSSYLPPSHRRSERERERERGAY